MIDNFYVGFGACAVVMTVFPRVAVKINGGVRAAITWTVDVYREFRESAKKARGE